MDQLRKSGDSVGAKITVTATGVPAGWGEPVYGRLDAEIAYAMMGINAVKGVEIGAGFASVAQKGSEHGDEMTPQGFLSNHAGGVLGGISTGQDLVVNLAIKPTSSIRLPRRSVTLDGQPARGRNARSTRPLRRHPRDADCRGHAGPGVDRSGLASSRPVRRCGLRDPGDSGASGGVTGSRGNGYNRVVRSRIGRAGISARGDDHAS
jgi:chorismate synthase